MNDERMEELASLHVLGALYPDEAREFKKALEADPELQQLVAKLSAATEAIAGTSLMVEPPPHLRAKILAKVAPQPVPAPEPKSGLLFWLGWGLAVCLAIFCLSLVSSKKDLRKTVADQSAQINALHQLADSLQLATNDLAQTVRTLQETNRLVNLRIGLLSSLLKDEPKAVAVTLWDESKQQGVFVVQHLKPLPADSDYQLWVLDHGTTPVDAGVFRVDEAGNVRLEFKTKLPIEVPGKFAVTKEPKGGVASPTLKNLVLMGS